VWTFVVELLDEDIELSLLLKQIGAGWPCGFFLEGQVHALVTAILLRMTRPNAFNADAQTQPPHRKPGEIEQPVGRSKGNTVIGADGLRQSSLFEKALEGRKSGLLRVRFHGLAQQQIARSMIGDCERITVAPIAEHELSLVVSTP
jgi:hypothetical protein